jgi:hypothetical protein
MILERLSDLTKTKPTKVADTEVSNQKTTKNQKNFGENFYNTEVIVVAVNRTTHAVRAFVLFLFYQLSAITLALAVYFVASIIGNSNEECSNLLRSNGACSPNAFLLIVAFVVWIFGVVYSSKIGWEEIKKSEVPRSSKTW